MFQETVLYIIYQSGALSQLSESAGTVESPEERAAVLFASPAGGQRCVIVERPPSSSGETLRDLQGTPETRVAPNLMYTLFFFLHTHLSNLKWTRPVVSLGHI